MRRTRELITASALLLLVFSLLSCGPAQKKQEGLPAGMEAQPNPVLIEGKLLHLSPTPEAKTSPYPDCLFSTLVQVQRVEAGHEVEEQLLLYLPGFLNRTPTANLELATGDVVRVAISPFSDCERRIQTMQQADTVEVFALPSYYAASATTSNADAPALTGRPVKAAAAPGGFVPDNAGQGKQSDIQLNIIQQEVERLRRLRDEHGGWDAWTQAVQPVVSKVLQNPVPHFHEPTSIQRTDVLKNRFDPNHLSSAIMLESFTNLRDGLRANGVDLIVAPVPSRDLVGIDHAFADLRPADGIWNPHRLRRNLHLLEHGIEVLDSAKAMRQAASNRELPLFYYGSSNAHPTGGAMLVHGTAIAERLAKYPDIRDVPGESIDLKWLTGFRADRGLIAACPFQLEHSYPTAVNQAGEEVADNWDAEVLLFGDSFLGGGIRNVVCAKLDFRLASLMRQSGAKDMSRHLARSSTNWSNYTAAVFVFDETLFFPGSKKGPWQVVDFSGAVTEINEYARLVASSDPLLKYNSQEDFNSLRPLEAPEGVQVFPHRIFIPFAGTALHLQSPLCTIRGDRFLLVYLNIQSRMPQTISLLLDNEVVRQFSVNRGPNTIRVVLDPNGDKQRFGIRVPEGGGNFFIEGLTVLESHVK